MGTERQRCEPGVDEKGPYWLSDPFWSRLNKVESIKLRTQPRQAGAAEAAPKGDARGMDLDAVWRRYSDVIRELEMTADELEALRNLNE